MYSKATLDKYVNSVISYHRDHSDTEIMEKGVCISKGNRKIGRVMNVSTLPLFDCGNCSHCSKYCYDIKAAIFHSNSVLPARIRNSALVELDRDRYFSEIDAACTRRRVNKFFRWHVAGDIKDADYFERMIDIARKHPDFVFWTYTKMFHIVNAWISENGPIPENMHIMFSLWDGMKTPNPYNMPVFACRLKDGNKDITDQEFQSMYKCPGNCDICKAAGRGCVAGESAYADEH